MRRPAFSTLDRYLLLQTGGTLASVFAIVISLMMLEHLARLLDIVSLSGRKAYVVTESMLALLPEYAGLGLLFGLYLAIALTIRRLSLRGELDIIQTTGISTFRWMRVPALLAVLVSGLLLWNQGWLIPGGERRLSALSLQMENGQFGYDLQAGNFTDLGKGITLRFAGVDPDTHELRGIFFRTAETTFTASRGRLRLGLTHHILMDLEDGTAMNGMNGHSLSFDKFHFAGGDHDTVNETQFNIAERRKGSMLPALLSSNVPTDYAVASSRLLWPAFALMVPFLAMVLGKPMRRSGAYVGLTLGVVVLAGFIRSTGLVAATGAARPGLVALAAATAWIATVCATVWGERRWGAGYIDRWLLKATRPLKLGRLWGHNRQRAAGSA